MWAQPALSSVSLMKSRRLRLETVGTQAIPRLQMSPMCIGVDVIWVTAQLAAAVPEPRLSDCAPYRFHWHGPGYFGLTAGPAHPPGSAFPNGSVGTMAEVRRYATSTWPGLPAAIAGKKCVPVSPSALTRSEERRVGKE